MFLDDKVPDSQPELTAASKAPLQPPSGHILVQVQHSKSKGKGCRFEGCGKNGAEAGKVWRMVFPGNPQYPTANA